jgi:hypothetical protein
MMNTEVEKMALPDRIRRGNDILWSIWLDAQKVADDTEAWSKVMDTLERGAKKVQGLVRQAQFEGYTQCLYSDGYLHCVEENKICFGCTYEEAPEGLPENIPSDILEVWNKAGRPVIPLGAGESVRDLQKYLTFKLNERQTAALLAWYQKQEVR